MYKLKNNNIKPIPVGVLNDFPFTENTFDSITEYEILKKLECKTNEIIKFINTVLEKEISEYIEQKFNDIMIDSMYEAETETLILYLNHSESEV